MKRLFLILFGLAALSASSQTQDSPILLHEGEQTITGLSNYSTVYMQYVASADQLVTISGFASSLTITHDGDNVPSYYDSNTKENIFAIQGGTNDLLSYFHSGSETEITITVSAKTQPYTTAQTCETAVEASAEPFFVPFAKASGFMGAAIPVYMEYTPEIDGKLTMHFSTYVSNFKYATSCDGTYTSLTLDYSNNEATLMVEANTEYIFQGTSSSAAMATFVTKVPVPGASCADAAVMSKGANTLPVEAGPYWFTFTTPQTPDECFVTLTTDADLTGGSSTISSSCSSTYGNITQQGTLHQRIKLNKATNRVLEIVKATELAAPATVTLNFEMVQEYDAFDTAPEITPGQTETTPDFSGTYYYSVIAPATGNYFLEVTSSLATAPTGLKVDIYKSPSSYFSVATGQSSARYNMEPGEKYVIAWTCPDGVWSMPFKTELVEVKQGETASDPLTAVVGENEIPASADVFFNYTAAANSWLIVTPANNSLQTRIGTITAPGSTASNVTTYEENGGYRFEGVENTIYQIEFTGATEGSSFTLATREYAAGETQSNPIIAGDEPVALPDVAATTWIKYTATADGIVDVSTTATYAYTNVIRVYLGEVSANESKALSQGSGNDYKPLSYNLSAGDVLNVSAKISPAQNGKVITFTPRDPEPGEYPTSAIHIDFAENPMTYEFNKTVGYNDSPVWYSIDLTQPIFNLESEKYFTMNLYAADNTETPIAQSSGSFYGPNKIENAAIATPGTYYLKLISSSAPFTATLSERDALEGETPANAFKITPDKEPYVTTIGSPDYATWYEIKLQEGNFNLAADPGLGVELYSSDNFATPLTKAQLNIDTWYTEIKDFAIATPGTYFIKVPTTNNNIQATLSGTAIYIDPSTAIDVIETGNATSVYFNMEGKRVDAPTKGIYIRVTGKHHEKIVVK